MQARMSADNYDTARRSLPWKGVKIMTNEKIQAMLNEQVTKELFSSYLYLAIADDYEARNLDGFANWFEIQAKEELDHALLFRRYLLNDDAEVILGAIEAPRVSYTSPGEGLAAALAHERMITASIQDIYSAALECKDYKTVQFLDWFIKEQGEEEKNATDLCKKFELFGGDAKGLYLLNTEYLARVYSPPSLVL